MLCGLNEGRGSDLLTLVGRECSCRETMLSRELEWRRVEDGFVNALRVRVCPLEDRNKLVDRETDGVRDTEERRCVGAERFVERVATEREERRESDVLLCASATEAATSTTPAMQHIVRVR